jgi:hypothetical protein
MDVSTWWSALEPATRAWLSENNGDAVPRQIREEIARAGGPLPFDAWWVEVDGLADPTMPDEAVDWIEEVSNAEDN